MSQGLASDRLRVEFRYVNPEDPLGALRRLALAVATWDYVYRPPCQVVVVDRSTKEVVLTHDFGGSIESAELDVQALREALDKMTMAEFSEEYGIDESTPPLKR
jgi:hypothetical protein